MKSSAFTALVVALLAVVVWLGSSLVRVENQRYALALGMCQADPLKMLPKEDCLKAVETRTDWWWHLFYALKG